MIRNGLLAGLAFLFLTQDNHPPVVKLTIAASSGSYHWNSQVRYSISVSDKEDGDTKFDEIPVNEILLEARYLQNIKDTSERSVSRNVLQLMMSSNCMNCHAFTSKLIGPSYYDIANKYSGSKDISDVLVKHIINGSSGVWGNIVMPTHPELTPEETGKMVKWILNFPSQKNVSYYLGTEGAIQLQRPPGFGDSAWMLLTAAYLDRGKSPGEDKKLLIVK